MKIAILTVYFLTESTKWIAKLQLEQIRMHSAHYDYDLFISVTGGLEFCEDLIKQNEKINYIESKSSNCNPSKQHGDTLDLLLENAKAFGDYDLYVTLDMDAFPINNDWLAIPYVTVADNETPIQAVFRKENDDTVLVHPCFMALHSDFVKEHHFTFYPSATLLSNPNFIEYVTSNKQRIDTGVTLSFILNSQGKTWKKMVRTNCVNQHYLMAGLYDNLIFHIGATSREPIFSKEIQTDFWLSLFSSVQKMPLIWRFYYAIRSLREKSIARKNSKIYSEIARNLQQSPDDYFKKLQTGNHIET